MKEQIISLLHDAVAELQQDNVLPSDLEPSVTLERARDAAHGDYASNLALTLAKPARKAPRDIATALVAKMEGRLPLEKIEIAGPGFINFYLGQGATNTVIQTILEKGDEFGKSTLGNGKSIQVEFVSANPTGPLHVGHGRGAAYGAAVADLLAEAGYKVDREYYVNDAGRQMDILATSVWLRLLELKGENLQFPSNGYKGDYILDIAKSLDDDDVSALIKPADAVFDGIPDDEPAGGDKEKHIDALIDRAKSLLGDAGYLRVFDQALNAILGDIRQDLSEFGVNYERWYSERSLGDRDLIKRAVDSLTEAGHIYEKEGALWFKSTDFGDEKDRVVIRDNGQSTYFASDIAYHFEKLERGYDEIIDVWGADHHGYVPRVRAALSACGKNPDQLTVLLVQFAILYRGKERVQMSTRSGSFVTLRELREDVGNDAARFFYAMRKCEQHLDFDLELAKSQSNDNPVYYIQYAHARICTVFEKLSEQNLTWNQEQGETHLSELTADHEEALIRELNTYPELIERAAKAREPHQIAQYLRGLAGHFHAYYNAHRFIDAPSDAIRDARFCLIAATRQVLSNGLRLLGVSAPSSM